MAIALTLPLVWLHVVLTEFRFSINVVGSTTLILLVVVHPFASLTTIL